eukprot:10745810-Karenia_brevis.AAC.1
MLRNSANISKLTCLHDVHAQLCSAATQVFDEILHIGNQYSCHAPSEHFDAYSIEHQVAAAQANATRNNIAYVEQSRQSKNSN